MTVKRRDRAGVSRGAPLKHLRRRSWMGAVVILSLLAVAPPVSAVRIKDITHLKGRRENRLIGYGLVVGLSGTGDGSKYETTILTLQSL